MHEPFLTETFALSKKKLEQAGRLDHDSGAAHVELARRASQERCSAFRLSTSDCGAAAVSAPTCAALRRSAELYCKDPQMRPKKVILCVDDNEQSLSIRKFMLETRGYRVLAASSGREALEAFQQAGTVDLVLADLLMPEMDGAEVIRVLKELAPEVPMILISGKVRMYEKNTVADIFLPKGTYPAAELLERIRILLIKKRGPRKLAAPFPTTGTEPSQQVAAS
jgi:CheY-like chemotaxis protein